MDPRLPNLFRPLRVKSLHLKNRLVMAPMATRYAAFHLHVTDRLRTYHAEAARGGVGLVTIGFCPVAPDGRSGHYLTAIWSDDFIPGFRDLVDDIHAAGAQAAVLIAHAGAVARSAVIGTRPLAPSAIAPMGGEMPKSLSTAEVKALVESFAQAARRGRDAGFDSVELHAAHGYLLNQFLSPLWNQREDRYGGSTENRCRFLVEILERTRELLGREYPLMARLCVDEFVPGGIDLAEGCRIARILESAGVDILDITGGTGETVGRSVPGGSEPADSLSSLAAAVRQAVSVPVVAVGKLHRPQVAESLLAEGKADLIALGRALIADPDWPAKAAEGRWDEIRPCLLCASPDCHGRHSRQLDVACVVNPTVGREQMFALPRAARSKKVMVVGGGPAGIEAAMAASKRGHHVTLYDRQEQLGGQLLLAAVPPHKDEMWHYVHYLRCAIARSGVRVVLGSEVTVDTVVESRPDVVVVTAGSRPSVPAVKLRDQQAVTAWDVLSERVPTGNNVLVVGGGDVGCETAQFLAARGKAVTILEMLPEVAGELIWWRRGLMLRQLAESQVDIVTHARLLSVEGGTATCDRAGLTIQLRGIDTVVFASGVKPENELARELAENDFDVRAAGDCVAAGNLGAAVRSGFEAGISID